MTLRSARARAQAEELESRAATAAALATAHQEVSAAQADVAEQARSIHCTTCPGLCSDIMSQSHPHVVRSGAPHICLLSSVKMHMHKGVEGVAAC